jgi:hypothetical protein
VNVVTQRAAVEAGEPGRKKMTIASGGREVGEGRKHDWEEKEGGRRGRRKKGAVGDGPAQRMCLPVQATFGADQINI